jgi:hypothetical protein
MSKSLTITVAAPNQSNRNSHAHLLPYHTRFNYRFASISLHESTVRLNKLADHNSWFLPGGRTEPSQRIRRICYRPRTRPPTRTQPRQSLQKLHVRLHARLGNPRAASPGAHQQIHKGIEAHSDCMMKIYRLLQECLLEARKQEEHVVWGHLDPNV